MALATQEREKERRGGALPPVLLRPAAVPPGFGAGGAEVGLGRLFWGVNGRGGFLGLARAVFGPAFTPSQLTLLGAGLGATLFLGLVVAFARLGAASNDVATATAWPAAPVSDASGAALTRPTDGPRPTPEDLLGSLGSLPEAATAGRQNDAPKSEPAAPQAAQPAPEAGADAAPVEEAAPSPAAPRLFSDDFGFKNAGVSSGGGLRDGLNAGLPAAAAAREAAFRPVSGDPGSLSAPARSMARARLAPMGGRQARASRAAGQLRFANHASTLGLGSAGADAARQYSSDAFEQKSTIAGPATGGVGLTGGEVSGPLGVGAPDVTQTPSIGPVENQTPYQDKADDAKKGIDMAVMLMALGAGLMAMGLALLVMGKQMMANPVTASQGSMMMKIGAMMLMAGLAALAAGAMMANDAKKKGKEIGKDSGQKEQGRIVENCADDALGGNRCAPKPLDMPRSSVQEDVAVERKALTGGN